MKKIVLIERCAKYCNGTKKLLSLEKGAPQSENKDSYL
jgi:hypothetical protein